MIKKSINGRENYKEIKKEKENMKKDTPKNRMRLEITENFSASHRH